MDINPSRVGWTPDTISATSTNDISSVAKTVSESWLEGIFYQKPSTTVLTITLTLPNGSVIQVLSITALEAITTGYLALSWPVLEGSTLTVTTTGGVSGDKIITPVFRPMRG